MKCSSGACTTNVVSHSAMWMHVVRALESVALLALIVSLLVALVQDFYLTVPPSRRNKTVEIFAFTAAFVGITGAIIFWIQWSNKAIQDTPSTASTSDPHSHDDDHNSNLQWGFALVLAACIVALLSAVAIGYSRCRHAQPRANKRMTCPRPSQAFEGENVSFKDSFKDGHDVDSSSMMLVPHGHHFDPKTPPRPRQWGAGGKDPPPYALPPPYPYSSQYDFFLPMANSSVMPQITGSSSAGLGDISNDDDGSSRDHRQTTNAAMNNADLQAIVFQDSHPDGFSTPAHSFASPGSSVYDVAAHHRPMMQPLYLRTASEGGSRVEITPSAQNSTGLPSPYNRF